MSSSRKKALEPFRFKKFDVNHSRSAMRVGVDGVLTGCWAEGAGAGRILDVGTGCGLIALIMAQRTPGARITGIDIDPASADEARENAAASPWASGIRIITGSFPEDAGEGKFDLIVSNPPYFDSGVATPTTRREAARHQGALSPHSILRESVKILTAGGSVAMIVPADIAGPLCEEAELLGYHLWRRCLVRGHKDAPFKRALLQWRLAPCVSEEEPLETELTLEEAPGIPTDAYRQLCREFYLKW